MLARKTRKSRGTPAAMVLAGGVSRHGASCGCRYCTPEPVAAPSVAPASTMEEIGDPAHVGALVRDSFREALDGPVFRDAVRLSPGVYTVTYVAGLPPVERTVIARVTRYERQTFIDWLHGDAPDEVADQAVRFGLTAHVEAEERAAAVAGAAA